MSNQPALERVNQLYSPPWDLSERVQVIGITQEGHLTIRRLENSRDTNIIMQLHAYYRQTPGQLFISPEQQYPGLLCAVLHLNQWKRAILQKNMGKRVVAILQDEGKTITVAPYKVRTLPNYLKTYAAGVIYCRLNRVHPLDVAQNPELRTLVRAITRHHILHASANDYEGAQYVELITHYGENIADTILSQGLSQPQQSHVHIAPSRKRLRDHDYDLDNSSWKISKKSL